MKNTEDWDMITKDWDMITNDGGHRDEKSTIENMGTQTV